MREQSVNQAWWVRSWSDRKPDLWDHAAPLSTFAPRRDFISLIRSENRILQLMLAWTCRPDTFRLTFVWSEPPPPAFTPQWPQCLSDVWAHWRGAASLCACATPAPGKYKKKGEKMCRRQKGCVLNEERINPACLQVDGCGAPPVWGLKLQTQRFK